jgi:hypothetical protein
MMLKRLEAGPTCRLFGAVGTFAAVTIDFVSLGGRRRAETPAGGLYLDEPAVRPGHKAYIRGRTIYYASMPTYKPQIIERTTGPEQCFDANILSIEKMDGATVIAFGDLVPTEGLPLTQGTPIHSLVLQLFGEDLTVELNESG